MHTNLCVLIKISMGIGVLNFYSLIICLCNGAWNSLYLYQNRRDCCPHGPPAPTAQRVMTAYFIFLYGKQSRYIQSAQYWFLDRVIFDWWLEWFGSHSGWNSFHIANNILKTSGNRLWTRLYQILNSIWEKVTSYIGIIFLPSHPSIGYPKIDPDLLARNLWL